MSAGTRPGCWSPSLGNVILVPLFQPGLILIVSTLSSIRVDCPSGANTFLKRLENNTSQQVTCFKVKGDS